MKIQILTAILIVLMGISVRAQISGDPQTTLLSGLASGDTLEKMSIDVNGDGKLDLFFTLQEAHPDPSEVQANTQNQGGLFWDAYVKQTNGTNYIRSSGMDDGGGLIQGVTIQINPNQMYVGNISEINRYGVVTSAVKRATTENSTIIYAYTWEGDHFKQWKLAEYTAGGKNAIFDKYLADGKRTQITVQQIKP